METANEFPTVGTAQPTTPSIGLEGVTIVAVAVPRGGSADRRAGAIAARVAAAGAAKVEADMVEVVRRPGQAPAILGLSAGGRVRALPVTLTVSHRLGRAVAAAHTATPRLGIDLEREGVVRPGLERLFLAPSERWLLERHDATTLWALKEAAWKALGLHRSVPFHAVALECDADGEVVALRHPEGVTLARAALWRPWHRFIAALLWLP